MDTNANLKLNIEFASLTDLRQEFRRLQVAMSEAGKTGDTELFQKLKVQSAQVKDAMGDLRAETNALSSDATIQNFAKLGSAMVAAYSAGSAVATMFGADEKDAAEATKNAMVAVQLLQAAEVLRATILEQKVLKAIQDDIKKTAVFVSNAAKQAAAWALANPYAAVAIIAVAAITAAVLVCSDAFDGLTDSEKEAQAQAEAYKKINTEAAEDIAKTTVKLGALKDIVLDTTKSEQERKSALEEIKRETNGVINVTNLNASSLTKLKSDVDAYIISAGSMAEAQAAIQLATEAATKKLEAQSDADQFIPGYFEKIGNFLNSSDYENWKNLNKTSTYANQAESVKKLSTEMDIYLAKYKELYGSIAAKTKAEKDAADAKKKADDDAKKIIDDAKKAQEDYIKYLAIITSMFKKHRDAHTALLEDSLSKDLETQKNSYDDEISAIEKMYIKGEITDKDRKKLKEEALEINGLKEDAIREKWALKAIETEKEKQNKILEEDKKYFDEYFAMLDQNESIRTSKLTVEQQAEVDKLTKSYQDKVITSQEYEKKLSALKLQQNKINTQAAVDFYQKEFDELVAKGDLTDEELKKQQEIYKQLNDAKIANSVASNAIIIAGLKTTEEETLTSIEKTITAINDITSTMSQLYDGINSIVSQSFQNQQISSDNYYNSEQRKLDRLLKNKTISDKQYTKRKEKLDEDQAKKNLDLKIKQAKQEKTSAIFSIGISTAQAIANSLKLTWPLNLVMAALVGVMGAAELATVASKPLPTFATGGLVQGPGSGTSDSINARISNGEYIINADATSKNKPLLDSINYGNSTNLAAQIGAEVAKNTHVVNNVNDTMNKYNKNQRTKNVGLLK